MDTDTIAAISTALGMAAVGVVRISGKDAVDIADKIFTSINGKTLKETPGYHAHYGKIYDDEIEIDEAVALVFRAPRSYTGEDVVEISCHGGIYTTQKTLQVILKNGATPAQAGEFTKRAYLNGKMELTEAEAVLDIIKANNMQYGRAAISAKNGALHKYIHSIKDKIIHTTSHLCAYLDYPEEEIPEVEVKNLLKTIENIRLEIQELIDSFEHSKIIREGIDTAIIGKPNVGKSTLMNLLADSNRSIVTDIPGTTRDVVEESVNLGNIPLKLSDTAGIHYTDDPVEQIGVQRAKDKLNCCELVLAMFDASKQLGTEDKELIENLKSMPCIAVINKCDLEQKFDYDYDYIYKNIKFVVKISAKTGEGKQELVNTIEDFFKVSNFEPSQAMLFNERQKQSAINCLNDINNACVVLRDNMTLDAVSYLLEQAVSHLSKLDGSRTNDELIDDIFSRFCVGK